MNDQPTQLYANDDGTISEEQHLTTVMIDGKEQPLVLETVYGTPEQLDRVREEMANLTDNELFDLSQITPIERNYNMNDNTNEYAQTIALTDIEDYLMSQLLEQYADALERGETELTVSMPSFAYDLTGDATTGVSASTVAEDIRRFADSSLNGHPDGAKPLTKKDATPEAAKLGIQL